MLRAGLFLLAFAAVCAAAKLPEKYANWVNTEVVYILTSEERKEFLTLEDDALRDRYIEEFWESRNPARGSGRNPFREEHYRRVAYANETFGRHSGTPGWKTDMGRTYILFGKPESRVPVTGYSELCPMELWMYSNASGSTALPSFFYVLFFMPDDIGEYRYYKPFTDGPMRLARGGQLRSNRDVYRFLQRIRGDLAHASLSLTPSEPADTDEFRPSMSGDSLVARIQSWADLPDQVERVRRQRLLKAQVNSVLLIAEQPPAIEVLPLAGFDGSWWLDYAVLVDDARYGRVDGQKLAVSAGFRLLTKAGELIIEDSEERAYEAFDNNNAFVPFVLANRIPMTPGAYRLQVTLTNRSQNRVYRAEREIAIGAPNQVSMAGPMLAAAVERAAGGQADAPFRFSGIQFVPAVDGRFAAKSPVRALVEIHAPDGEPAEYELEYVLAHLSDRTQRTFVTDRVAPAEFRNGVLLKARTLPIDKLEPGEYRAMVNLRKPSSMQVVASVSAPLRIQEAGAYRNFYLLANLAGAASNGLAAYIRGLQAAAQNDRKSAAKYLSEAIEANPGNTSAKAALARLK